MFCDQCGKPLNSGARFCHHCGASVSSATPGAPTVSPMANTVDQGAKDTANVVSQVVDAVAHRVANDAPSVVAETVKQVTHKGTIIASFILAAAYVVYYFIVSAFAEFTDLREGRIDMFALFTIACSGVPFGVIGLPVVLGIQKKLGPVAKLPKGQLFTQIFIATFIAALAQLMAFADLVEDAGGIIRMFGFFLMIGALVTYISYGFKLAQEGGLGALFTLLIGFFAAFLISFIVAFLAMKALAILAIVVVLVVVFKIVGEQQQS